MDVIGGRIHEMMGPVGGAGLVQSSFTNLLRKIVFETEQADRDNPDVMLRSIHSQTQAEMWHFKPKKIDAASYSEAALLRLLDSLQKFVRL